MASNNPFFNLGSLYGNPESQYDTALSRNLDNSRGEFERFITGQGFGAFDRRGDFARGMYSNFNTGFNAAQTTRPDLTWRQYLNTYFSPNFIDEMWRSQTPSQRGERPSMFVGNARWVPWG